MRILIFGATGGTGRELVAQALQGGHDVTAFVRTPGKVTVVDSRLRVVQGDIQLAESIDAAIPGHDAVVSALGAHSLGRTTLLSEAAREIVATMQGHGVRRIIWESSLGIGETRDNWAHSTIGCLSHSFFGTCSLTRSGRRPLSRRPHWIGRLCNRRH
jgi:putative NADH-flavin reductase